MARQTPPPYANVSGIYRQDDKHSNITLAQYDGNARPGELVVNTADYSLWIGNSVGNLNPISGGSGNGMVAAPIKAVQFNKDGTNFGGSGNFTWDDANAVLFVKGQIDMRGDIIPTFDNVYSLGSSTNSWKEIHVAGNTIYMGGVPLSMGANSELNWAGDPVVTTSPGGNSVINGSINISGNIDASNVMVANNITATQFFGNGSGLTGIIYANIEGNYNDANVVAFLQSGNSTNIVVGGSITAATYYGDGGNLSNIGSNYGNSNVAAYLATADGLISANTLIANYILSTHSAALSVTSNVSLGSNSTVFMLGGVSGQVLSTDGLGNLSWINNGGNGSAYGNSNVADFLPINTSNVSGAFFIGDGSLLTNVNVANVTGTYSNSNVAAYLPVYSGNISADVLTANIIATADETISEVVTANSITLGNGVVDVTNTAWLSASSNSLSDVLLYSVASNAITGADFAITARSGTDRQMAKIMTVTYGNAYDYSEYGSLNVGNMLGNFFVSMSGSNLQLLVTPMTANAIDYTVVVNTYL